MPVSVVYKKGFARDGSGRLFLYAYGAYGIAIAPTFNSNRLSLLDRGFACAIAHIRGGDDLGYGWFLDGKLTKRTNTFNDFVDVAKGLVAAGFAKPGRIGINGGSAGGELMGAVANMRPELWGAVVADVPFVDVLATMLDDTLPLTPGEWPEWGNPITDKAAFDLIRSYSPYDNVRAQDYPPMLITGGLSDPRVTYWEPAKWAAKLRATKTDDNLLLLKINMGAGHGGKSGRWESAPRGRRNLCLRPDRDCRMSRIFEQAITADRATSTSSAMSTMRCGCSGSRMSRWRIGVAWPIPAHDATPISGSWCGTRSIICAPVLPGETVTRGPGSPERPGRALDPAHGIHRATDGKAAVRARTAMGDHRQGRGPADPGSAEVVAPFLAED